MSGSLDDALELAGAGDFAAALAVLEPELATQPSGDVCYLAARLWMQSGDLPIALHWVTEARSAFESEGNALQAIRTDLGRINILDDLTRHDDAIEVGRRLQSELAERASDLGSSDVEQFRWMQAAAAENLGASLGLTGRHAAAVRSLRLAEDLYGSVGSMHDQARVIANLGIEKLETGRPDEAILLLEQAMAGFSERATDVPNESHEPADPSLVHRCQIHLGRAHALAGHYGQAMAILDHAGLSTNDMTDIDALRSLLVQNEIRCSLNLWPDVLVAADSIDDRLRERGLLRETATNDWHRARGLAGLGRFDAAIEAHRSSIDAFDELGLPTCSARVRVDLAILLEPADAVRELDQASHAFRNAAELRGVADAALVRADLEEDPADRRNFVEVAGQAGAADFHETAWRLDWHRALQAESSSDQDEAIACLHRSIASLEHLRSDLETDRQRAPFMVGRRKPLELLVASHLNRGEIEQAFDASLHHRAWTFREDGDEPTNRPPSNTVLYQIVGQRILAFVTKDAGPELLDLGECAGEVDELLVRLDAEWRHVSEPRLRVHLPALRAATDDILHGLYLRLFAPVEPHLSGAPVTIVPTGRLAMVPFHALHDGFDYLIDRQQISLALRPMDEVHRGSAPSTLVIGVADRLAPAIATEAERIAEITNGRLLTGADASADEIRAAVSNFDVIHLACHSSFEPTNPWLSSIQLGDRRVRAAELAEWDLSGQTVVLASCSSGRQRNLGEDELLGLPRALLSAGAAEVVMSLWPVDDNSAVGLNTHLHSRLAIDTTGAALRSAQLAAKSLLPHPYLWAAPTLCRGTATPTPSHQMSSHRRSST